MGAVGGDVAEERLVAVAVDEVHAFPEPDIGAVSLVASVFRPGPVAVVDVVVVPVVARVADAAAGMVDHLAEAAILRPIRPRVAQMPLAENAGGVAVGREGVRQGVFVAPQQRAAANRVPHAGTVCVVPGQETRAGRGTRGSDMVVGEADRLGMHPIQIGRADDGVAVTGQVTVALVVRDHEHYIRWAGHAVAAPVKLGLGDVAGLAGSRRTEPWRSVSATADGQCSGRSPSSACQYASRSSNSAWVSAYGANPYRLCSSIGSDSRSYNSQTGGESRSMAPAAPRARP